VIDAAKYVSLGTADADGRPWVTPVYFAHSGYREFYWLSAPGATHSRNLAVRPELSLMVFDSQTPIGAAQAVYMAATGSMPDGDGAGPAIEIFSRRSVGHGGRPWALSDVDGSARLRLYRAVITVHSILDPDATVDSRIAVDPALR
jgi:hypothetical protein